MVNITLTSAAFARPDAGEAERGLAEPLGVRQVGFWSALLATLCGLGYGLAAVVVLLQPVPADAPAGWMGIESYLAVFRPIQMLPLIPSLLLAPSFVALMVSVHYYAAPERRLWSHLGLAFTLLYAGLALANYLVQLTAVRRSLLGGQLDGLAPLVMGNPHSVFWALASTYILMNLAMLCAAPVFTGGRLERWARWLFVANGATAPLNLVTVALDNPTLYLIVSVVPWCVVFTAATAGLAALFGRRPAAAPKQRRLAEGEC